MKRLTWTWAVPMVACVAVTGSAFALDLGDLQLSYRESFAGQTGLPTTPEVDTLGSGSVVTSVVGNAPQPSLPLISQRVRFNVRNLDGAAASQGQAVAVNANALGLTRNAAVRGTFDTLAVSNNPPGFQAASVGIGFDPAGEITTPDIVVGVSVSRVQLSGLDFWAFQVDLAKADGTLTNLYLDLLPSAIQSAIAAGQQFVLTARFDRATRSVVCAVNSAGQEYANPPIVVPETTLPISVVSAAAQVANKDLFSASLGANDTLQVDLRQIELFTSTPRAVAALGAPHVALLAFALVLLGCAFSLRRSGVASRRWPSKTG